MSMEKRLDVLAVTAPGYAVSFVAGVVMTALIEDFFKANLPIYYIVVTSIIACMVLGACVLITHLILNWWLAPQPKPPHVAANQTAPTASIAGPDVLTGWKRVCILQSVTYDKAEPKIPCKKGSIVVVDDITAQKWERAKYCTIIESIGSDVVTIKRDVHESVADLHTLAASIEGIKNDKFRDEPTIQGKWAYGFATEWHNWLLRIETKLKRIASVE